MDLEKEGAGRVTELSDLNAFQGNSLEDRIESLLQETPVVLFGKTWCPFSQDATDFLAEGRGVPVTVVNVNVVPEGSAILQYVQAKTKHSTVPVVFVRGSFVGGCDELKELHEKGELETVTLAGLVQRKRVLDGDTIATARLAPPVHTGAMQTPFWFPQVVNNHVVRLTGLQVFVLSALSTIFHTELWARYLGEFIQHLPLCSLPSTS